MDLDKKPSKNRNSKITTAINIVLIILVIAVVGYFAYKKGIIEKITSSFNTTSKLQQASPNEIVKEETTSFKIIDIQGAIKSPGVYEMDSNTRVVDVVKAAGGFTEEVDANFVAQNINQAQKLVDGMKIYIPLKGVPVSQPIIQSPSNAPASGSTSKSSGLININTASQKDLESLPEVGEVTAQKIIASRPYSSIDELVKKGALKQSSLDKIKTLITV